MTHFFMTGPTTVFPKTKRSREKEPYSDEESDDVSTKGGNGRYYVDRVGERRVEDPVSRSIFPGVSTPQDYLKKAEEIQDPTIKTKFELAVQKKVKFEEERFITSPEGQRSLTDQASRVFLRDGRLAKQTASRKEAETGKVVPELAKLARDTLEEIQQRPIIDYKNLRLALEERNNLLTANSKEAALRIKLHATALDLEKADHELNERVFKNKAPITIHREDYRRREKVHTSLGFVFATLAGSYQRSEQNIDTLRSTDRFLVKHGVEALCVHCGSDLSLQSLLGSHVDTDFKDAGSIPNPEESTVITLDEGTSSSALRSQSPVESADSVNESSSEGGNPVIELK